MKKKLITSACVIALGATGVIGGYKTYQVSRKSVLNSRYELALKEQEIARVRAETLRVEAHGRADARRIEKKAHKKLGIF